MRRVIAPADHRSKSPSEGARKSKPRNLRIVGARARLRGVAILSWGAIGSLEVPTAHPGGVRFPGAPI
jgi:hypothetical protein